MPTYCCISNVKFHMIKECNCIICWKSPWYHSYTSNDCPSVKIWFIYIKLIVIIHLLWCREKYSVLLGLSSKCCRDIIFFTCPFVRPSISPSVSWSFSSVLILLTTLKPLNQFLSYLVQLFFKNCVDGQNILPYTLLKSQFL